MLIQDDDWVTGELNMPVGHTDSLHSHTDHLIYVRDTRVTRRNVLLAFLGGHPSLGLPSPYDG